MCETTREEKEKEKKRRTRACFICLGNHCSEPPPGGKSQKEMVKKDNDTHSHRAPAQKENIQVVYMMMGAQIVCVCACVPSRPVDEYREFSAITY